MAMAAKAYQALAWLFVLGVVIQFFLAGLGVLGGESIEAHREWGFIVLHLIPILMFLAALIGKMGRTIIIMTVVLFVLVFIQPLFADPEMDPQWIRTFHVLGGLFIFMFGYHIAQRVGMPWRMGGGASMA